VGRETPGARFTAAPGSAWPVFCWQFGGHSEKEEIMDMLPSLWSANRGVDPWRDFSRFRREMDNLFQDFFSPSYSGEERAFTPTCDVEEREGHYLLSFDLPGLKKEDIKINLQDNLLTISGERREESKRERGRSERFYGSFSRTMQVPPGTSAENVRADYRDGVLRLAIPKGEDKGQQQIPIRDSEPGFFERLLGSQSRSQSEESAGKKKSESAA
jgi:HSP20 family protein